MQEEGSIAGGDGEPMLDDEERCHAFDLGVKFAALQSRALRELQTLLRQEQRARLEHENRTKEETIMYRLENAERIKQMETNAVALQNRLEDEVAARKQLEEVVFEEKSLSQKLRSRLNQEEADRLALDRRVNEEARSLAALTARFEEHRNEFAALQERTNVLSGKLDLEEIQRQQLEVAIKACVDQDLELRGILNHHMKQQRDADLKRDERLCHVEERTSLLKTEMETKIATERLEEARTMLSISIDGLREYVAHKNEEIKQSVDEVLAVSDASYRRVDAQLGNESERLSLKGAGLERVTDDLAKRQKGVEEKVEEMASRIKDGEDGVRGIEGIVRALTTQIEQEVKQSEDRMMERHQAEKLVLQELDRKVNEEVAARQRLNNLVHQEQGSRLLLEQRLTAVPTGIGPHARGQ
ncbi:hypothetical protein CYMTET_7993 [Cymbomonas tetramitiformis]|uniref:Uncharacterized protein n=1 Tax=Cymbomonas tetramitiformis TaxID=36881 RepID=A0AAE0GU47_9CHLO|nr:hypothetical protein CYMTET_7993 [Cymbomonas tetramitiformis]